MPTAKSVTKKLRHRRGPITPAAVREAKIEVQKKTLRQIEDATGRTWGARAIAAWQNALEAKAAGREKEYLEALIHAATFKGEAIEHSAFGERGTLAAVEKQLQEIPY